MALTAIVAYDIADDRRRAHVSAYLQQYGDRVQRSVFLVAVGPDDLSEIEERLAQMIDHDDDSLYIFRQCRACWDDVVCLGQAHPPSPELCWIVL